MRLQYARLKVDHGWQKQNLNEVENLYFRHSQLRSQTQGPGPYPNASTALLYPGSGTSSYQSQQQQTLSRITGTSIGAGNGKSAEKGNSPSFYLKLTPPNPNAMIDPALLQDDLIQMDADDDVYSTGPLQASGKGKGKAKARPKTKSKGNGKSKSASPMMIEDDELYDTNNIPGTGARPHNTVSHHSDTAAALNAAFANNSNSNSSNTHANLNYNYNYTPTPISNSMPPPPPPLFNNSGSYNHGYNYEYKHTTSSRFESLTSSTSASASSSAPAKTANPSSSSTRISSSRGRVRAPRRRKPDSHYDSGIAPPSASEGNREASSSTTGAGAIDVMKSQTVMRSTGGGSTYDSFWSAHAPVAVNVGEGRGEWQNNHNNHGDESGVVPSGMVVGAK